jgi:hypothetical protein
MTRTLAYNGMIGLLVALEYYYYFAFAAKLLPSYDSASEYDSIEGMLGLLLMVHMILCMILSISTGFHLFSTITSGSKDAMAGTLTTALLSLPLSLMLPALTKQFIDAVVAGLSKVGLSNESSLPDLTTVCVVGSYFMGLILSVMIGVIVARRYSKRCQTK